MGCGGSKDEVATGNTVNAKSLQRGKSFEKAENTNGRIEDIKKIESTEKLPPPVAADESIVGGTDSKEAAVGKLISKDSPDLYFSSRKDDTAVAAVAIVAVDPQYAAAVKDEEAAPPPNSVTSPIDKEKPEAGDIRDLKEKAATSIEANDSDSTVAEKKN